MSTRDKEGLIKLKGIVTDVMPNTNFKVELIHESFNKSVLCHASGSIRRNKIRIVRGDYVEIEVSEYDVSKGRIFCRHRNKPAEW